MRGVVSIFSYVVKRFPHDSHWRLRLIALSSVGRESITFVFSLPQYGHFKSVTSNIIYIKFIIHKNQLKFNLKMVILGSIKRASSGNPMFMKH
jgi:hypothetical protein